MSDMSLTFRVQAEAAQAQAELRKTAGEFQKFGAAAQAAMREAATGNTGMATGFEKLRGSIYPAFDAAKRYQAVQVELAGAVERGEATQAAANIALEQAKAQYNSTATAAERSAAATKAGAAATSAAAREAAELTARYTSLRASIDPAFAATQRLREAQQLSAIAVRTGITTQAEATATLDALAAKLGVAGGAAEKFGVAQTAASRGLRQNAMVTGNVAAQFNDIGVMLAAGQNPFQLAIQQGTQLSQVFTQIGGGVRGTLGALQAGFLSLLSPTTLLTVGLIAGGAALFQWATGADGAEGKTKSLKEAVTKLDTAISDFKTKSSVSLEDLKQKFGEVTPEVIRLNAAMVQLSGVAAIVAATEAMKALKSEAQATWFEWATTNIGLDAAKVKISEVLEVPLLLPDTPRQVQTAKGSALASSNTVNPVIQEFQDAVNAVAGAKGFDDQIAAVQQVEAVIIKAAGGIEKMTLNQMKLLAQVQATEAALRQIKAAQDDAATAGATSTAAAQGMLDKLLQEVALRQAIRTYGEDSAQVAALRLDAERKVHQAMVDSLQVSGDMKDQLNQAWEAARGISGTDSAAPLVLAADAARDLFGALGDAWGAAIGLQGSAPGSGWLASAIWQADTLAAKIWAAVIAWDAAQTTNPSVTRLPGGVDGLAAGDISLSQGHVTRRIPIAVSAGSSGTGGGTGGGGAASDSVSGLSAAAKKAMDDLDLALATINEKVQAGLMSTAEAVDAVASAKDKTNNDLAALIAQIDRLGPAGKAAAAELRLHLTGATDDLGRAVTDLSKSLSDGFAAPFKDFIKGTIDGATAFEKFGDTIIDKMLDIAAQQATTNFLEPLFGKILGGGSGIGDWLMGAFGGGGNILKLAGGGPVSEPGTPTSDSIPALLSDGEYVVNAPAANLNRPLLDALNAGKAPSALRRKMPAFVPPLEADIRDMEARRNPPQTRSESGSTTVARDRQGWDGPSAPRSSAAPQVNVKIEGVRADQTATVHQSGDGMNQMITIILDAVDAGMGADIRAGRGNVGPALADTYGLRRTPR